MGMLKPFLAGTGAALASEEADAGVIWKNGKSFIEGWNGGPKGIDRFRDEFLGTGEGNHLYTFGHYLGDIRPTAIKYRNDRQKEYDTEANTEVLNTPLVKEMESDKNQFVSLAYGNAPPYVMPFNHYKNLVNTALGMFGKNIEGAQAYIVGKIRERSVAQQSHLRKLEDGMSPEDEHLGLSQWTSSSIKVLAQATGQSEASMERSIEYDIEASLPVGVEVSDLSEKSYLAMQEDAITQRLSLTGDRLFEEKRKRDNVRYNGDANNYETASFQSAMDGAERAVKYEAVVPDELAEKYGTKTLFDFDAVVNAEPREAGLYRNHVDMQLENMLQWEDALTDHPEAVKKGIALTAQTIKKMAADGQIELPDMNVFSTIEGTDGLRYERQDLLDSLAEGKFPHGMTGAAFANLFSKSVNKEALVDGKLLTQMLDANGVRGLRYQDGWSRNKKGEKEKTYNYVAYSDKYIDIMERGASTAPMNLLLAAGATAGLGAPLVLNSDIAKKFPMPPEEDRPDMRSGLDKVLDHKGFLTPYVGEALRSEPVQSFVNHPATQWAWDQFDFDRLEYPARLLSGMVEGIYNLTKDDMTDQDRSVAFAKRLMTPYMDTVNDAGEATMKATNSPALGAVAAVGTLLADPTNYIGP